MRWLLFLSRLAFVSNLFFLLSFSLQIKDWTGIESLSSLILIIGYALAFIFNPVVVLSYLLVVLVKKQNLAIVPLWLVIVNVLFLFLQIFFLLLLNVSE